MGTGSIPDMGWQLNGIVSPLRPDVPQANAITLEPWEGVL
jgi:hypothetical protein